MMSTNGWGLKLLYLHNTARQEAMKGYLDNYNYTIKYEECTFTFLIMAAPCLVSGVIG